MLRWISKQEQSARACTGALVCAISVVLVACGQGGCDGPPLDTARLNQLRGQGPVAQGPEAFLVVPNPIDATQDASAGLAQLHTLEAGRIFPLVGLLSPNVLENSFLKIRIRGINDSASTLARPNSSGHFHFRPDNIHYSEVMAYRSLSAVQSYIEALGFSVVQSRPLYVMVQADGSTDSQVNAYYDHGYLDPNAPRTIKLFGTSEFAPGVDQDMYWHEFGHLFNESLTAERGMDFAGDTGAVWTEGAAIHECLADYLAMSTSDRPYIGKWIARGLGYGPGEPLRSAVDLGSGNLHFESLVTAQGRVPERYEVAEWCSRVLWDIRERFVQKYAAEAGAYADRLIYAAASLLGQDAGFADFQSALLEADDQIHCGGFSSGINSAFTRRGFTTSAQMDRALAIQHAVQTVRVSAQGITPVQPAPGVTAVFNFRIQNPTSQRARNVRVRLESASSELLPLTYEQGFGDLLPGQTISVGLAGGLSSEHAVVGEIDQRARSGSSLSYRLRVRVDNGSDTVIEGTIRL